MGPKVIRGGHRGASTGGTDGGELCRRDEWQKKLMGLLKSPIMCIHHFS